MVDFGILASGEISFHAIGRRGSMTRAHLLTLTRASVLTVVFLGAAVALPARAEDSAGVAIVDNGQPLAKIYVTGPLLSQEEIKTAMGRRGGGEAADVIKSAAILELVYHLEAMSGATLPVVTTDDAGDVVPPGIVLGELAHDLGGDPQRSTSSKEAFRLSTSDGLLLIGGESDLAVRHGVYEVLRQLGVDWVMPGEIGEIIPQRRDIKFGPLDITSAPDFTYRNPWYRGFRPRSEEELVRYTWWSWRQKAGAASSPVEHVQGHVWQRVVKQHQEAFDADPTMLALVEDVDGDLVRRGPQLETIHPDVIDLFVEQIRSTYEENIAEGAWTSRTPAGFAIGPADGLGYSISAESIEAGARRIDPIVGAPDQTDLLVHFSNRILDAVDGDYPNAMVGYYSYSTHADFPVRYVPHPNLVQVFAPINFSRFHGVADPISKTQSVFRDVVAQWGELAEEQGNPLSFYGYNWNLADNMLPYTKVRIWGEDLPFFHAQGIRGLTLESTKQWSVLAPSDYVFMRMAWNVSQDWRDLLRAYSENAYGAGAEPMLRYWHRLIETQREAGMEAGSYYAFPLIYDLDWVSRAETDIAEALALAQTEDDRTRIRYVGIGVEFLRLYLEFHEATLAFDFDRAARRYLALHDHWRAAYTENSDLVASEVPGYLERFLGDFINGAHAYSSLPYQIVAPLPDALKTAFDPYSQGERLGLHRPEIVDDHFITTRTVSSTWDAQGLAGLRDGAVWYRWRFDLPRDVDDSEVGLFLGGVEDTAHVWLNGEKVGQDGPAFGRAMTFTLSDHLERDGENLLAIQVIRNGKANEIGLGGILRPSFIFMRPSE